MPRAAAALDGLAYVGGQGMRIPATDQQVTDRWRASLKDPRTHAQLVKLLGRVAMFSKTTEVFRQQLVHAVLPVEYSMAQVVFRQNEPGNWMGIVLEGRLERRIQSTGAMGVTSDAELGVVTAGGMVGDMGVLGLSTTRTVTVTALEESTILVLSRRSLEQAVTAVGSPDHFPLHEDASQMQNLMMDTDAICELACFKRLDRDFVLALCEHLEPRLCYPNEVLMRENNYGNEMYILQVGSVKVEKGGKFLVKLNGGVVLGELAVLGADKRRTATVTCVSLSLVYVLHGDIFHEILEAFPRSKKVFDHAYIARLVTFELTKVQEEVSELDRFYGRAHPMKQEDLLRKVYNINPNSQDIQLRSVKKQGTRLPKLRTMSEAQPGIGKISSASRANLGQHWMGNEKLGKGRPLLPGESGYDSADATPRSTRSCMSEDATPKYVSGPPGRPLLPGEPGFSIPVSVKSARSPSGAGASLKPCLPLTARSADGGTLMPMTSPRKRPTLTWDESAIRAQ